MRSFAAQSAAVFASAVFLAGLFLAVLFLFGPSNAGVSVIICDGEWPRWVLDAQNWEPNDCVRPIPFDQAPKGADWTPVCTGMCGLCPEGTLYVGPGKEFTSSDQCTEWPPDQPWPSGLWYDWRSDPLEGGTKSWPGE
jgi:hypothetical protein